MAAPLGLRKALARLASAAVHAAPYSRIFTLGMARKAETPPEMWTRGQGFEHRGAILALARSASYVTISSPKTIRELSHVD